MISADGHPVSGGFVFSIGKAGAAPALSVAELAGGSGVGRGTTIPFGVARGVQYGAITLAIGALAFLLLPWLGGLRAVMPGRVLSVFVKDGEAVAKGAPLMILEAMKMEHTLTAPSAGRVGRVLCAAGDQVKEGAELLTLEDV